MKYGQQFEEQSVPGWSLHNIDYNSLKTLIKTHTSKDQATAVAIPGQQDPALKRFEDGFYNELRRQHDRVDLFVLSKADEIARRLRHLSGLINRLIIQCTDSRGLTPKRQRRFAKYSQQVSACGKDIRYLDRFVNAQIVAFRKILKKYRKWTGSTSLDNRFKEGVLSSPKSFTKRDFHALRVQHQELVTTIEAASPRIGSPEQSPYLTSDLEFERPTSSDSRCQSRSSTAVTINPEPTVYWNEYDHGSEAGDQEEEEYAIYIDPNESLDFPGVQYVKSIMSASYNRARRFFKPQFNSSAERRSLLNHDQSATSPADYFTIRQTFSNPNTDNEATEDEYASSEDMTLHNNQPGSSYVTLPALEDQKLANFHDRVLNRGVIFAFVTAFLLLVVSGILIMTGRHKLRLEVDAGVTVGSVASLFCACMGLGCMFSRHGAPGWMYAMAVWSSFVAACVLNAMLLVLVVGSNGL